MKCSSRGHRHSNIIEIQDMNEIVRRNRKCSVYGFCFNTCEQLQDNSSSIHKKERQCDELALDNTTK